MLTDPLDTSQFFVSSAATLGAEQIAAAVSILQQGGLVAFPTETVYGLGAAAENPAALDQLYTVKGRPKGHPVIVHLANVQQIADWAVEIPSAAWQLAYAFWPGPLTLILKRAARVPDTVTGGQDTVGLRVPAHPVALQLLQAFGSGVAAPSANRFGRLSPTRAAHVQADLGDDVDMILDGGDCLVGVESTIVAFREGQPVILRPGMITAEQIEAVLNSTIPTGDRPAHSSTAAHHEPDEQEPETTVIRAPGTLASHYAPRTPLHLVSAQQLHEWLVLVAAAGKRIGILARQPQPEAFSGNANLLWVTMADEPEVYARQLYAQLRDLDQCQLAEIWVEAVPALGAWAAVADRLRRAAHRE